MTSLTTRLDAVDRGFLKRLEQQSDRRQPPIIKRSAMVPAPPLADRPEPPPVVLADSLPETLVDRLLRAVPGAWANLAERVEDARRSGAVVIAITGARRGEGRTTVVQCLTLLAERAWLFSATDLSTDGAARQAVYFLNPVSLEARQ